MLVVFPVGLLGMSVIFDLVYFANNEQIFEVVAYWMMIAGIVSGLVAAPFGLADWTKIPKGTRAKRVGAVHGIGNVVVVVLFLGSVLLRDDAMAVPPTAAYVCSFLGLGLALVTAWLGGELVDQLGVGVHDEAHVDAPSSLSRAHHRAG
jgi:uncharacterized membrane protein